MFENKNVIITGGSKGIGKAIVEAFIKERANIIFTYNNNSNKADNILEENKEYPFLLKSYKLDVSKSQEVEKFMDFIEDTMGNVDVLVNNAGVVDDDLLIFMNNEKWEKVIHTNLYGCFYMCKNIISLMPKRKGGSIVNISSTGAIRPSKGQANYAASKAGMIALTESIAREYATKNIRANAVAPGFIQTDMVNVENIAIKENIKEIPMKRLGNPEEVANVVIFLASEKSSYVTAQTILVDGGRL